MFSHLETHQNTFFWKFAPYIVVVVLLIAPIILYIMPKRKAGETESATTTVRMKKAKVQEIQAK